MAHSIVPALTAERLRELLHYDPETGIFTRLVAVKSYGGGRPVGSIVTSLSTHGYLRVGLDGKRYAAHRLAFLYMTGAWPAREVDHIDGVRTNNCWSNLRDVCSRVNKENRRKARSDSRSGLLGAFLYSDHPRSKPYSSHIRVKGKQIYLGSFFTEEEAHAAHIAAKRKWHDGNTL